VSTTSPVPSDRTWIAPSARCSSPGKVSSGLSPNAPDAVGSWSAGTSLDISAGVSGASDAVEDGVGSPEGLSDPPHPARTSDAPRTTAIGDSTALRTRRLLGVGVRAPDGASGSPQCARDRWERPGSAKGGRSGVEAADLVRLGDAAHADAQRGVAQRDVLAPREVGDVGVALVHALGELLLDLREGPPVRLVRLDPLEVGHDHAARVRE